MSKVYSLISLPGQGSNQQPLLHLRPASNSTLGFKMWFDGCIYKGKVHLWRLSKAKALIKRAVVHFTMVVLPSSETFPSASGNQTGDIFSHVLPFQCRLNGLQWVKNESLEAVSQVTHLDLRNNRLDSLDLSSVCNLETLHCQRNQLGTLTLSGFTLRMLNASSNRESNKALSSCCHCLTALFFFFFLYI